MSYIELGHCPLRELRLTKDEPVFRFLADPTRVIPLNGPPFFVCTIKTQLQKEAWLGLGRCSNPNGGLKECPWARVDLGDDSSEGQRETIGLIGSIYLRAISEADKLH